MSSKEVLSAARVPYGARGGFPSAGDMGDKALYVDPSDNQALWQVQSGNWVKIALGSGSGGGATPGVPVLHGPYVVDYTDIPHDGDTLTLWTPAVGDCVLSVFSSALAFASFSLTDGELRLGQDTSSDDLSWYSGGCTPGALCGVALDLGHLRAPVASTDPIQVRYVASGDGDLTAGHVDIYTLIARAVAP